MSINIELDRTEQCGITADCLERCHLMRDLSEDERLSLIGSLAVDGLRSECRGSRPGQHSRVCGQLSEAIKVALVSGRRHALAQREAADSTALLSEPWPA